MSLLDTSIIAQAGAINDPARQNALKEQAIALRQAQQQEQSQNALRKLYATPGAIDPKTGQPTPQAMQQIMAIDPDTGMKLRQQSLEDQVKQAELAHDQSEIGSKVFDIYGKAASSSVDAYNAAIKAGKNPNDAAAAARAARNSVIQGSGGIINPDQAAKVEASPWDLQQATALAGTDKEWVTEKNTDRRLTDTENRDAQRQADEDRRLELLAGRQQTTDSGKWDHTFKDENGNIVEQNSVTGAFRDVNQKPVFPKSLTPISGQPRSAQAMSVAAFKDEYRRENGKDPSAEDIQKFMAQGTALSKAARDWATGPQGNTARSLDVAVSHIGVLDDLVKGLKNGDVNLLNAAKNRFTQEFGGEAPNDFNAAKGIVSDEILKAVLGSGAGSQADREELQKQFSAAQSPEQLEGVIRTAEKLMSGQLQGLRRQYKRTTGGDDFDDNFLSDQTRKVLEGNSEGGGSPGAPAPASKGPSKGDVDGGYTFLGGDPADPKNWKKQ